MKIMLWQKRADNVGPAEFKAAYERDYVPVLLDIFRSVDAFIRNYIDHDRRYQPEHIKDVKPAPTVDVISELSFGNRADYDRVIEALGDPDVVEQLREAEAGLIDAGATQIFAVDEHVSPDSRLVVANDPVKVMLLMRRKPGLTTQQFIEYYERNHAILASDHVHFSDYRRNFVDHHTNIVTRHLPTRSQPEFDVITSCTYPNPQELARVNDALANSDMGHVFAEDEGRFLDRDAMELFFVEEFTTRATQ